MKFLSCVTKCIFEHLASNILTLFGVLNYIKSIKLFLNEAFKSKIGLKLNNTEKQSWRHQLFLHLWKEKNIFGNVKTPVILAPLSNSDLIWIHWTFQQVCNIVWRQGLNEKYDSAIFITAYIGFYIQLELQWCQGATLSDASIDSWLLYS